MYPLWGKLAALLDKQAKCFEKSKDGAAISRNVAFWKKGGAEAMGGGGLGPESGAKQRMISAI